MVSHDVGGVEDAYRTIYMHVRNGPDHDAAAAWDQSVPTCNADQKADYVELLEETGVPQKAFWARRDATNNLWCFFDPYGIYARPDCHPAGVTDPLGPCARWGSA